MLREHSPGFGAKSLRGHGLGDLQNAAHYEQPTIGHSLPVDQALVPSVLGIIARVAAGGRLAGMMPASRVQGRDMKLSWVLDLNSGHHRHAGGRG